MLDGNIVNFYIHRLHTMKAKLVVIANKGSVCLMGIGDKYKGGWWGGGVVVRGDLKRDVLYD